MYTSSRLPNLSRSLNSELDANSVPARSPVRARSLRRLGIGSHTGRGLRSRVGHVGRGGTPPPLGLVHNTSTIASPHSTPTRIRDADSIMEVLTTLRDGQLALQGTCARILSKQESTARAIEELKDTVSCQQREAFTLKSANLELSLRKEIGRLFCLSLDRYPSADLINTSIKKVVPRQSERHVLEAALKEAKSLLSTFRTEERRRVLGLKPTESLCLEVTAAVMNNMVDFMKAPKSDVTAVYT